MTGDPSLADMDRFMIKNNSKLGNIELLFLDGNKHQQSFNNKRNGEFLVPKSLRENFGGLNIMKRDFSLDQTPERSISAASKLKAELPADLYMESIPLKELSSLVEDIQVKT